MTKGSARVPQTVRPHLYLAAALLGVLAFGALTTRWSIQRKDQHMRADLIQQARILSQTIPLDRVKTLHGNLTDEKKPAYRRLKEQLMAAVQINPAWKWIYLMDRRSNGSVFFQLDSEAYDAPDPSPPGQTYDEASPTLHEVFDSRISTTEGPLPDRWGTWVSAFVPLTDPKTGRLITVVGIDIEASTWQRQALRTGIVPALATLLLLLLLLAAFLLRGRQEDATGKIKRIWRHLEAALAISSGLILTLVATWMARQVEINHQQEIFTSLAQVKTGRILDAFLSLRHSELEGLARFIEGSERVTTAEFRRYARHLTRVPEVLAWAWVPIVPAAEKEPFEHAVRDAGWQGPAYRIWEFDATNGMASASGRDPFYPIYHVEASDSLARYGLSPGRDLGATEPIRHTLEHAAASRLITASDLLPAPPHLSDRRSQILIFRPAGKNTARREIQGYAMAAVDPEIFLKAFLGENLEENRHVSLELLQLRAGQPPQRLAAIGMPDSATAVPELLSSDWALTRPILTFGKTYGVTARPTAEFLAFHSFHLGWIVLLAGLSITAASALTIGFIVHRREDMERLVDERTFDLATSMRRFDQLARQSRTLTWETNADGLYTDLSPVVEDLLGFRPDELIGKKHFFDLHPAEGREEFKAMAFAAFANRTPFLDVANPIVAKNGDLVWVATNGMPIVDADGRLRGYQGTDKDITDRKRAEDALANLARQNQEAAQRYAALISASNTGAWEYNDATGHLWCSPEYFSMLGRDLREFDLSPEKSNIEAFLLDLMHPDDRPQARSRLTRYLKNPAGMYEQTFRMQHKDGHWVWIWSRGRTISDKHGKPTPMMVGTHIDISATKRAEEALRESEQKYRMLTESMKDVVWTLDVAQRQFLYVSPSVQAMRGFSAQEVMAAPLEDSIAPEDRPALLQRIVHNSAEFQQGRISSDTFFTHEFAQPCKDGSTVIVETLCRLWRDNQTGRIELHGVTRDITDRKRAELELKESRRRYAALLANLPGMAYRCQNTPDWTMDFVSEGCLQLTGYAPGDLLGNRSLSFNDLICPPYREHLWRKWQQTLADHGKFEDEYEITTRDGEIKWVWEQGEGVYDEQGCVVALEGFIADITDRKRAEAERERLTRAIEQSREIVVITDASGTMLYVNPAFTRSTGFSREEAIGRNPRILQSGQHDAAFYADMWKTLLDGRTWEGQLINKTKAGALYTEQASISPVRDLAGHIIHFVAVKHDITRELQDQKEKESLQSQLLQSQKMESIGRLAGGVAHDFNNMLQAILGYAEMAIEQVSPGQSLHTDLKEIQKAAQRSAALTRQLQAFARKQAAQPKVLDLNAAVENLLAMLRRLIGEDIHLAWIPGAHLGPVRIDPTQLDQIVANLCVNARDAVGKPGHVVIETRAAEVARIHHSPHGDLRPGSYVVLAVRDDGEGIPPDVIEHIFEPFFTTKQRGQGTGLGLSTVYGIVQQNNGTIQVHSEPGAGAVFEVYLPRQSGRLAEDISPVDAEPEALGGHETILLVDDEETILQTTRRILESLGYAVIATPSPHEALLLAERYKGGIDLLLTDVIMPDMNGPELVRRLRSRYPKLRGLYMSGYTANLLAKQGLQEADLDYIPKPFSRNMLARKIREAFGK